MSKHIFVANAPGVIQTSRGRYRIQSAGDIIHLSGPEADQVRSATFPQRNLLTYLGIDDDKSFQPAAKAVSKKKKAEDEAAPLGE